MTRNILLTAIMLLCSMMAIAQSWSKDLEKAAKKGDVTSQLAVANAYFNGNGVNADKVKAAQWYYKATLGNNAEAKAKLYSFYSKELEKFAKSGDSQAQYEVGLDYFEGTEVAKNIETAAKWFQLSATQGHKEAKAKLSSFYSKVLENLAKTDAEAMYYVGCYYFDGKGIAKNEKKGFEYLKKSYESGNTLAFDKMTSRYTKLLVKYGDKVEKAELFYRIGNCYFDGKGISKNLDIAADYYERAMLKGHEQSRQKFYSFESAKRTKRQNYEENYYNYKLVGDSLSPDGLTLKGDGRVLATNISITIPADVKQELLKKIQRL